MTGETELSEFDKAYVTKRAKSEWLPSKILDIALPLYVYAGEKYAYSNGLTESKMPLGRFAQQKQMDSRSEYYIMKHGFPTPKVVVDSPTSEKPVLVDCGRELIPSLVEFSHLGDTPQFVGEERIEVRFENGEIHIRDIGVFEYKSSRKWVSITSIDEYLDEVRNQTDFERDVVAQKYSIAEELVDAGLTMIRAWWLEEMDVTSGWGVVESVNPLGQGKMSEVIVQLPDSSGTFVSFRVTPPSDWSETNPVVRFVEDVGGGLLDGVEGEEVFVSLEPFEESIVAHNKHGLYLYASNPNRASNNISGFMNRIGEQLASASLRESVLL